VKAIVSEFGCGTDKEASMRDWTAGIKVDSNLPVVFELIEEREAGVRASWIAMWKVRFYEMFADI
jgi:hypothetical protein